MRALRKTAVCILGVLLSVAMIFAGNISTATAADEDGVLDDVVQISGTLALKKDGTVWGWGFDDPNAPLQDHLPHQYPVDHIVKIYGGSPYMVPILIRSDGAVFEGSGANHVPGLFGITDVSCSEQYLCLALKNDGTVWQWGGNVWHLDGNTEVHQVPGLSNVSSISILKTFGSDEGDGAVAFAATNDGSTWAWGTNGCGEFGNGTTISSKTPVQVNTKTKFLKFYHGFTESTIYAIDSTGELWAWGFRHSNTSQKCGTIATTPQRVGISNVSQLATNWSNNLYAITRNGTVYSLDENNSDALQPNIQVEKELSDVTSIQGTYNNQIALGSGGSVFKRNPMVWSQVGGLGRASQITTNSAPNDAKFVLQDDGTVWGWGKNNLGQLGNGTTEDSDVPVRVGRTPSTPSKPDKPDNGDDDSKRPLRISVDEPSEGSDYTLWYDTQNGRYIGDKIALEISVAPIRKLSEITSVKVTLPDTLSFEQGKHITERDILVDSSNTDFVQYSAGNAWVLQVPVYLNDPTKFVEAGFPIRADVVAANKRKGSATRTFVSKKSDANFSLIRKVDTWGRSNEYTSWINQIAMKSMTNFQYDSFVVINREQGTDKLLGFWNFIAAPSSNFGYEASEGDMVKYIAGMLTQIDDEITPIVQQSSATEWIDLLVEEATDLIFISDTDINKFAEYIKDTKENIETYTTPVSSITQVIEDAYKESQKAGDGEAFKRGFQKVISDKEFGKKMEGVNSKFDVLDKILSIAGTAANIMAFNANLDSVVTLLEKNELYENILTSIRDNAKLENARKAAADILSSVHKNDEELKIKLENVSAESMSTASSLAIADMVSKNPYTAVAYASILFATNVIEKANTDDVSTYKAIAAYTDLAYATTLNFDNAYSDFRFASDATKREGYAREALYALGALIALHTEGNNMYGKLNSYDDPSAWWQHGWVNKKYIQQAQAENNLLNDWKSQLILRNNTLPQSEWYANILCPLDVVVKRNGVVVAELKDGEETTIENENGTFRSIKVAGEYEKYLRLVGSPSEYQIELRGTNGGTAEVETITFDKDGKQVTNRIPSFAVAKDGTLTMSNFNDTAAFSVSGDIDRNGTADDQQSVQVSDKDTAPDSVSINTGDFTMNVGETRQLIATYAPLDAKWTATSWSSDNTKVASVNADGKVTAVAAGTATITVNVSGTKASVKVTVAGKSEPGQPGKPGDNGSGNDGNGSDNGGNAGNHGGNGSDSGDNGNGSHSGAGNNGNGTTNGGTGSDQHQTTTQNTNKKPAGTQAQAKKVPNTGAVSSVAAVVALTLAGAGLVMQLGVTRARRSRGRHQR